jgi:glutathione peroxidase
MSERNETIYRYSAELLDGRTASLGDFRGRVLLIVNTASRCGFTPQYAGLEELYQTYHERGLEVLGFPCNQFGSQEPGSPGEIAAFCATCYSVSFPMFARIDVNGKRAHPLYDLLKRSKPGLLGPLGISRIRWNFAKFLLDREGNVVGRFGSSTSPKALAGKIEELLGG